MIRKQALVRLCREGKWGLGTGIGDSTRESDRIAWGLLEETANNTFSTSD